MSDGEDVKLQDGPGGADEAQGRDMPGVIAELGTLPQGAIVTEDGLARIFRRCTMSVKRAVERQELPAPVKMFGQNTWTVGAILRHVEDRLERARAESKRMRQNNF